MKHQLKWVKKHLLEQGNIRRNYCLENYCSRLGSIINKLMKPEHGFVFEKHGKQWGKDVFVNGKNDFQYTLVSSPYKKVVYTPQGMQPIVRYERVN